MAVRINKYRDAIDANPAASAGVNAIGLCM
jgi:hypothetical protein